MDNKIQKVEVSNQGLTISKQTLPMIWQNLQVKAADSEMDAARLDTPKLYELVRMLGENGADVVMLMLKAGLRNFIKFTGSEWSPDMIDGMLNIIKTNYGHLTMAQWKLFFEKAMSGKMAQEGQRDNQTMIARITPIMMSQWLLTYSAKCEDANEEFYAYKERNRPEMPETEGVEYIPQERLTEALNGFVSQWQVELEEKQRIEQEREAEQRAKDLAAYAMKMGINLEEVQNDINKPKDAA